MHRTILNNLGRVEILKANKLAKSNKLANPKPLKPNKLAKHAYDYSKQFRNCSSLILKLVLKFWYVRDKTLKANKLANSKPLKPNKLAKHA